jgi:hypothetical protein
MNENKGYRRLMMSAAVSLGVLCLLGIGSLMGWWPPHPAASESAFEAIQDGKDGGCGACGVVESIRVETILAKPSGIGALADNDEVGTDPENDVGKEIKQQTYYQIQVRMTDGTYKKLYIERLNLTVGQKVKLINGHIVPYSNS